MKKAQNSLILIEMNKKTASVWTHLILLLALTYFGDTHAAEDKTTQAESEWSQAQQDYYSELKKLKSPRNPDEVKALKERILDPKKKALQQAYSKPARPQGQGVAGSTTTSSPTPIETPKIVLDGKGVKAEIRYSKKGAPEDMTKEESPDYAGPEVISAPNDNGVGEIKYPVKKKK